MIDQRPPCSTDTELDRCAFSKDADGNKWPIVLFRDADGDYWYQLPVAANDPATATLFGSFEHRRDATAEGRSHLKEIG